MPARDGVSPAGSGVVVVVASITVVAPATTAGAVVCGVLGRVVGVVSPFGARGVAGATFAAGVVVGVAARGVVSPGAAGAAVGAGAAVVVGGEAGGPAVRVHWPPPMETGDPATAAGTAMAGGGAVAAVSPEEKDQPSTVPSGGFRLAAPTLL